MFCCVSLLFRPHSQYVQTTDINKNEKHFSDSEYALHKYSNGTGILYLVLIYYILQRLTLKKYSACFFTERRRRHFDKYFLEILLSRSFFHIQLYKLQLTAGWITREILHSNEFYRNIHNNLCPLFTAWLVARGSILVVLDSHFMERKKEYDYTKKNMPRFFSLIETCFSSFYLIPALNYFDPSDLINLSTNCNMNFLYSKVGHEAGK